MNELHSLLIRKTVTINKSLRPFINERHKEAETMLERSWVLGGNIYARRQDWWRVDGDHSPPVLRFTGDRTFDRRCSTFNGHAAVCNSNLSMPPLLLFRSRLIRLSRAHCILTTPDKLSCFCLIIQCSCTGDSRTEFKDFSWIDFALFSASSPPSMLTENTKSRCLFCCSSGLSSWNVKSPLGSW